MAININFFFNKSQGSDELSLKEARLGNSPVETLSTSAISSMHQVFQKLKEIKPSAYQAYQNSGSFTATLTRLATDHFSLKIIGENFTITIKKLGPNAAKNLLNSVRSNNETISSLPKKSILEVILKLFYLLNQYISNCIASLKNQKNLIVHKFRGTSAKEQIFSYEQWEKRTRDRNFGVYGQKGHDFLVTALEYNDVNLIEKLIEHTYDNNVQNKEGKTFLHLAVEANRPDFVRELIRRGLDTTIKDAEGYTPFVRARANHCITLCRILAGDRFFKAETLRLYRERPQDLSNHLIQCFFQSETKDIFELISSLKNLNEETFTTELEKAEKFINTVGTLIARFPLTQDQNAMRHIYHKEGTLDFTHQQIAFGNERFQLYQEALKGVSQSNWSLEQVYKTIAIARKTPKGDMYAAPRPENTPATTFFEGRYRHFLRFGQQFFQSLLQTLWSNLQRTDLKPNVEKQFYTIYFTPKNGDPIPLTTVCPNQYIASAWYHTDGAHLPSIKSHLSCLFEEIKGLKDNPQFFSMLKEKIALFYWLSCHAMVMSRGSSQYSLEIHKLLYELHGYSVGPLAQKYVLPDCVALSLPFKEFYENYYNDLFEVCNFPILNQ